MRFFNLVLLASLVTASAFAAPGDPVIQVSKNAQEMDGSVRTLMDNGLINGAYDDDNGKSRTDKMFYGVNFSITSSFRKSDVDYILNPANGRLPQLFKDPMSIQRLGSRYSLATSFSVIKKFHMQGKMDYSVRNEGTKTVHLFSTHSYNMFLYQQKIRVEVSEGNTGTKIRILQIAAVKGSAQDKLDDIPFGNKTFKGKVLGNVRQMASALGRQ